MWGVKICERLKDVKQFVKELPLTPIGTPRPFKIERVRYISSKIHDEINEKIAWIAGNIPGIFC